MYLASNNHKVIYSCRKDFVMITSNELQKEESMLADALFKDFMHNGIYYTYIE